MVSSSQEAWVRLSYLIIRVSRRYFFLSDSKQGARDEDGAGLSKLKCGFGLSPSLVKTFQPLLSAGKFVFIFLALATLSQLLSSQGNSPSNSSPSFLPTAGKSTLNHMMDMKGSSSTGAISSISSSSSSYLTSPQIETTTSLSTTPSASSAALATSSDCKIPSPQTPKDTVIPVIAASFPGAGTRILLELTEAFTGLVTIHESDYDREVVPAQQQKLSVMVETAYPYFGGQTIKKGKLQKTVLFLRNPLTAISALYQSQRQSSSPSSSSASFWGKKLDEPDWISWRDANFNRELDAWSTQVEFWLDYVTSDLRFLLPMERIVDPDEGPEYVSERLASFLAARVPVASPGELPCLWSTVMKSVTANDPSRDGGLFLTTLLKGGSVDQTMIDWVEKFPLTYTNYQRLLDALLELKKQYTFEDELQRVLKYYIRQIEHVRWS